MPEEARRLPSGEAGKQQSRPSGETLIFVDVDGVLNVGVRDGARPPLLLDDASARSAQRLWDTRAGHPERQSIERLMEVHNHSTGEEGEDGKDAPTFATLACRAPRQFSEELVRRFAALVRASGWRAAAGRLGGAQQASAPEGVVRMVLTSTWRAPQHRSRLRELEDAVSDHLGQLFRFDEMTQPKEARSPEGRLGSIGHFLAAHCSARDAAAGPLTILVLDDFYSRPFSSWPSPCGSGHICSEADAERFLLSCVPAAPEAARARVVHTYAEWTSPEGLLVQVGTGLTKHQVQSATLFLQSAAACAELATAKAAAAAPRHLAPPPDEEEAAQEEAGQAGPARMAEEAGKEGGGDRAAAYSDEGGGLGEPSGHPACCPERPPPASPWPALSALMAM